MLPAGTAPANAAGCADEYGAAVMRFDTVK